MRTLSPRGGPAGILRVNPIPASRGGGRPGLGRKEAGLSAQLPDSHAQAQWAAVAPGASRPPRDKPPPPPAALSPQLGKIELISLQPVSKMIEAIKAFTADWNLFLLSVSATGTLQVINVCVCVNITEGFMYFQIDFLYIL